MNKFNLICKLCNNSMFDISEWFAHDQSCPKCNGKNSEVYYTNFGQRLIKTFLKPSQRLSGMWQYYDVLPLESMDHIVTAGEGNVSIDRWMFLEKFARDHFGIDCQVYAHRQDNNNATGSFKDLAGSLVASILWEHKVNNYVVASTGNIGVAFARYIAKYGGTLYAFIPQNSPKFKEAEISIFGQKVFRVSGDYSTAKKLADEFASKNKILLAAGTYDPMRVEAKKTMAFEWFRHMDNYPTVYIQALSGGTGPIGVIKGCNELIKGGFINRLPRLMLVQSDKCSPMADAWFTAKEKAFPNGWENTYPICDNPDTDIPTLATGNPTAYPFVSSLVRESMGEIITFPEELVYDIARVVACETAVRIGPAATVAVGGFFKALQHKCIVSNDIILINIGEGIRRDPEFMTKIVTEANEINNINECSLFHRDEYKKEIWSQLIELVRS